MNSTIQTNKVFFPSARSNRIKLVNPLECEKCQKENRNRKSPLFETCSKKFNHLIQVHNALDKNEQPTLSQCLKDLQKISDQIHQEIYQ